VGSPSTLRFYAPPPRRPSVGSAGTVRGERRDLCPGRHPNASLTAAESPPIRGVARTPQPITPSQAQVAGRAIRDTPACVKAEEAYGACAKRVGSAATIESCGAK